MAHKHLPANLTFAGRQQALEKRFNDFQSKLDRTLIDYEGKMADLHSEIHDELSERIDELKKDIDEVWTARTDKMGNIANDLSLKLSNRYHRHIGTSP